VSWPAGHRCPKRNQLVNLVGIGATSGTSNLSRPICPTSRNKNSARTLVKRNLHGGAQ
jgi:hypothetical protein